MLNKIEMHTCKTSLDSGKEYIYTYYLTESLKNISIEEFEVCVPSYGIGIKRQEFLGGQIIDTFEDKFDSVSPTRTKVASLIDYLIDNEVSPIHLIDVIGESVDNWIIDYEIEAIGRLSMNKIS